jgi:glutamate racemase
MKFEEIAHHPIGIFDSGIGGLTVAKALLRHLPKENIIYFGDTAHMPYGDKSPSAIQAYAIKITEMLLAQECKLILIACYSATTAAYELIKEYIGAKALVVNVVDPVVQLLKEKYAKKHVGLIGTRQTVHSNVFKRKVDALNLNINLSSYATNLLAQAIEEFGNHPVVDALLEVYLANPDLQHIDALVLACTHYPIIQERVRFNYQKLYHKPIEIVDSSDIVAQLVKKQLQHNHLLHAEGAGHKHFYISDYTDSFAANAKLFFGESVLLEHYPLWD